MKPVGGGGGSFLPFAGGSGAFFSGIYNEVWLVSC